MAARPKVVIYGVASVDGRLTLARGVMLMFGDRRWDDIAGPESDVYRWIRSDYKPQAYLEGSGSLVCDGVPDPLPQATGDTTPLYEDFLPESVVHRAGQRGWFAVVDSRGMIRWAYKEWPGEEWEGWHLLVVVSGRTPPEYLAYLRRETIPYIVAGEGRVDLSLALGKLSSKLGVERVISTSPGKLGGALLKAGLADELNIEFVPAVVGGFDTPSLFQSPPLGPDEWPVKLKLISACVRPGGRVWLRYGVLRDPQGSAAGT